MCADTASASPICSAPARNPHTCGVKPLPPEPCRPQCTARYGPGTTACPTSCLATFGAAHVDASAAPRRDTRVRAVRTLRMWWNGGAEYVDSGQDRRGVGRRPDGG